MSLEVETLTTAESPVEAAIETQLTAADRCDRCGAQAWVRVELSAGHLLFCGHHGRAYAAAYTPKALLVHDETARMQAEFTTAR